MIVIEIKKFDSCMKFDFISAYAPRINHFLGKLARLSQRFSSSLSGWKLLNDTLRPIRLHSHLFFSSPLNNVAIRDAITAVKEEDFQLHAECTETLKEEVDWGRRQGGARQVTVMIRKLVKLCVHSTAPRFFQFKKYKNKWKEFN